MTHYDKKSSKPLKNVTYNNEIELVEWGSKKVIQDERIRFW